VRERKRESESEKDRETERDIETDREIESVGQIASTGGEQFHALGVQDPPGAQSGHR
jgi:hypothetical protein